jgi:hypothetical protein
MSVQSAILPILNNKKGKLMNLDEFKKHVEATRKASTAEAMSVLSATITTPNKKEAN